MFVGWWLLEGNVNHLPVWMGRDREVPQTSLSIRPMDGQSLFENPCSYGPTASCCKGLFRMRSGPWKGRKSWNSQEGNSTLKPLISWTVVYIPWTLSKDDITMALLQPSCRLDVKPTHQRSWTAPVQNVAFWSESRCLTTNGRFHAMDLPFQQLDIWPVWVFDDISYQALNSIQQYSKPWKSCQLVNHSNILLTTQQPA